MFNIKSFLPFTKNKENFWTKNFIVYDLLFLGIILIPVLILVILSFIYYGIGYNDINYIIAFQKYCEFFMIPYGLIFITIFIDVFVKMSDQGFKKNKKTKILSAIFILIIITVLSYGLGVSLGEDLKNIEILNLKIK